MRLLLILRRHSPQRWALKGFGRSICNRSLPIRSTGRQSVSNTARTTSCRSLWIRCTGKFDHLQRQNRAAFRSGNRANKGLPFVKGTVAKFEMPIDFLAKKIINTTIQLHLAICQSALVQVARLRHVVFKLCECRYGHKIVTSVIDLVENYYFAA